MRATIHPRAALRLQPSLSSRLPLCLFAVLAAWPAACSTPGTRPAHAQPPRETPPKSVRPSLEEIFLEPPLFGTPPTLRGLSADGSTLLLAWSPPTPQVRPGPEAEHSRDPRPALRLLDLAAPEASGLQGTELTEILGGGPEGWNWCSRCASPQAGAGPDKDAEEPDAAWIRHRREHADVRPGPHAFSHRGARLAVALGEDLFLIEPGSDSTWVTSHLIAPDPAGDSEEDATGGEGDARAELPDASIQNVSFDTEDESLWITAGDELYRLDLGREFSGPLPLLGLPTSSADIEAPVARIQWNSGRTVAFANRDLLAVSTEESDGDAQKKTDEQDAPPARQVFRVEEKRGVSLAGMEDEESLESGRISPDGRLVFALAYDRSGNPEPTLVPDYLTERVTVRHARRLLADATPSPWRAVLWDTSDGTRTEVLGAGIVAAPELEDSAESAKEVESDAGELEGEVDPEADDAIGDAPRDAADVEPGEELAPIPEEALLPASWTFPIGWAPQPETTDPARFALERRSADFKEREIWILEQGAARLVFHERDPHWIGGPATFARWTADGKTLLLGSENAEGSTRPGWGQLFALDPAGGDLQQLTDFAGEMRFFRPLSGGAVLLEASEEDPAQTSVFLLPAPTANGTWDAAPRAIPFPPGWSENSRASWDGSRIVTSHESLFAPAELWTSEGTDARPVTRTLPTRFTDVDWIEPERMHVTTEDGRTVYAHVYLPPGVRLDSPGRARATIVFVHGAGYLQNVTNSMTRYPLNMMFHSRLATLGYPVIDVDYRGSAGYGRDFRGDVQYHLGGKDLDDIHQVVDHLVRTGLVDSERVGLYGGSYGGFMTMMALFTAPDRWAAGAALRSVTDWRTYHPFYTQPRLGRPSTHPDAYRRSSPIDLVDGLEDPLLILHGMVDQNVFAQDSIRLIEKLIDRGKRFDAMLYPSQGHGFQDGPHWLDEYGRIERFLRRHLGSPLATDPRTRS